MTKNLLFLFVIFSLHNAYAQTNNTNASQKQVPVLDIKQILDIANSNVTSTAAPVTQPAPSSTTNVPITVPTTASPTTARTTVSTTPTTTTTSTTPSTTTSATSTTTPSTTTSTTTTTTTPSTTTTTTSTTTTPSTTISTTSTTTPSTTTSTAPTTTTSTTSTTTTPSTTTTTTTAIPRESTSASTPAVGKKPSVPLITKSVLSSKPAVLSENAPNIAPEPLRERTTEATTTTTTTTKAPEPIRLGPIVEIRQGPVRPIVQYSRGGKKYYAFKGIPYANPPVHFQRFKEPSPVAQWSDVLNATSYGPSCIQYNILTEKIEGEEGCLTLSIFTSYIPGSGRNKNKKREPGAYPVMVFFHQGAFMFGTSKDFEEKYMMDEPVVLVTVQYRLGAFGFLNTQGDSDARGNQGLKDQVLALKFVRDNIHKFNGEPNLVTIFGESAGGSSVHYHLLSERSRGLFNRAISMSGTALSPWAFTRSPRKMAKKLGTFLNCPTSDMNELFSCLQGHDARIIADKTKDLYEWNTDPITPFAPSIEVEESQTSFITDSPYNLMKSGRINDATPWMLGVVENVCLLDAWSVLANKQLTDDMNVDWHRIAPATFMFKETALEPDAVSNQIRAYYFGTKDIGNDTSQQLEQVYSDRYFNWGIRTSALMHVRTNEAIPVYMYLFSYKGAQSHTQFAGITDVIGVSEGDELRFLFNTNRFDDIPPNSKDGDISQKFVKLWVSFAKEGKPTAVWGNEEWKRVSPAQVKGDEALMYYSLNETCGFIDEPFLSRMNFWDTLPLNENENELLSSLNIHQQNIREDEDIFGRYS